ncbi:MAG TPA: YbjN domain-containing protein, partial [Polyangiaceae bacterium]|nr:YbjN domain-containing protein [Polyangiaceae bacterium]
ERYEGSFHPSWLDSFGWQFLTMDETTLRIFRNENDDVDFFLRNTSHWILLKIVPAIPPTLTKPSDITRRLLAVNRDMRLAKHTLTKEGDIALAVELPKDSLEPAVLRDAIERMHRYISHYRSYLSIVPPPWFHS